MDPVEFMVERTDTQTMNRLFHCEGTPNTSIIHAELRVGANTGGASSTPGRGNHKQGSLSGTQMSEDKPWTTGHRWTALGDKRGACGWKVVAYVFPIKPRVGIQ